MQKIVFAAVFLVGLSTQTWSCCGEPAINDLIKNRPDEQQGVAFSLYKELYALDEERLAYLNAKGDQVCSDVDCKDMEAAFVQQLVSLAANRQQRNEANRLSSESNKIAWIGVVAAIGSGLVAVLTFLFSLKTSRRARRNEETLAKLVAGRTA